MESRYIMRSSPARSRLPPPDALQNGDQFLSSMNCQVIYVQDVLERKRRNQDLPYESDQDLTDEEIAAGLMEITALSLTDVLEDEPAYE